MKIVSLTVLLAVSIFSSAQNAELIKGKWTFKDIAEKDKLDSLTLMQANVYFGKMKFEFAPGGNYIYGQTAVGTWALNSEGNKVTITSNGKSSETEIKKLVKDELHLNMGKAVIIFGRPAPEKPVATSSDPKSKICGVELFTALAKGVRSNSVHLVKVAALPLGISGYTEKQDKNMNVFNPDPGRQGENCTMYTSLEKPCNGFPFTIEIFESGVVQASRPLSQEEVEFARKEFKISQVNKTGWMYLGSAGLWEYWENDGVLVCMPGENIDMKIGGDCTVYKKPLK